jgi:hypothetical protein
MLSLSQGVWITMLGSPTDALELPAVVAVEQAGKSSTR